ncbi:MAG: J domain-containing protein [Deltaproteobacteria bacterium]|nr:J domain-containing protein [Deltaproteobacteria bacterium]
MSSPQASVFQKHRSAGDVAGDTMWASSKVTGRAVRCTREGAARDVDSEFELAEGDRVLWRLLHVPRRFADLEKAALMPPDELRAALRALIAADAVEVVDADQGRALLPAELKRARAEASGKTWRPATGALVAKVYRPEIDGGAGSVEGSANPEVAPHDAGATASRARAAAATAPAAGAPHPPGPPPSTGVSSPGFQVPRTTTGAGPTVSAAPPPRTAPPAPAAAPPTAPPASSAPSAAGAAVPAPPQAIGNRPLLPTDRTTYTQLAQAHAAMARLDHYAFLGLLSNAEEGAIRAAYVGLARDYHPDRIAGSPLGDDPQVRGWIEALFKRLGEAQKTLMNAESRARYDREQKALAASSGGATTSAGRQRRPLEARNAFIMAETFFKKKDYAQAELHYRQASNFDPEEGLIAVALAWCIFVNPERAPEQRHDDARKRLEEAIKKFNSGDAAYKLGRVLREMGDEAGATKHFQLALRITPNHVDAQREVRIIEMRRAKEADKSAEDAKAGLLGKLFKR